MFSVMRISKKCPQKRFTLIELLVVVSIIAVLAGMLLPVLSKAKETAKKISCMNNMKQLTISDFSYASDYKERLSGVYGRLQVVSANFKDGNWISFNGLLNMNYEEGTLFHYVQSGKVYKCPSVDTIYPIDYAKNMQSSFVSISRPKRSSATALFVEEGSAKNGNTEEYGPNGTNDGSFAADIQKDWTDRARHGHSNGDVFSFFDGHIQWRKISYYKDINKMCDFTYTDNQ